MFLGMCLAILASSVGYAQGTLLTPLVTMGITLPAIGKPASIQVLVTNPTLSPVPTGQVTIDFGDGSGPSSLSISTTRVETTHIYTAPGQFTITASYVGDGNFAPATASLSTVSVLSSPVYTLRTFGDSLTGAQPGTWPLLLAGVLRWPRVNYACGGCRTNDMAPSIYQQVVDDKYASTWLLGQNDPVSPAAGQSQFQHASLAENAWLAIPEGPAKLRAQSKTVTQSGTWMASDLYTTTGLRSTAGGSSLTASVPGSTIYVGLSSLLTTDYTVDVLIDGVDQGTASPASTYAGEYSASEPYGLRYVIGGSGNADHTVKIVCQDPGTSGCYVDWIGGNGAAKRPNLPPYLWTAVSYTTPQADPLGNFPLKQGIVRGVESQLESDGFAIRVADIAALFNGPALPQCVGDGVHPNECGNQIEETVWLSAMSYLATEAQRIDIDSISPTVVGIPVTLDGRATSGLPVTYSVVSGSGNINGDQLTVQQAGNVVIEADQSGNATVLPATPVQLPVTAQFPTTTNLSSSALDADYGSSATLTATVTSTGGPVTSGTVTMYDGSNALGSTAVDAKGLATLMTSALPLGTDTLTASYAGNTEFLASTSRPISMTIVLPPDFTIKANATELTVKGGQSVSTSLSITPLNGFNQMLSLSCAGLPAGGSCGFAPAFLQSDGTTSIGMSISTQRLRPASMPRSRSDAPLDGMGLLAGIFLLKRRSAFVKALRLSLGILVVAGSLAAFTGCGSARLPLPITSKVIITAQTQAGLRHSTQLTLTIN